MTLKLTQLFAFSGFAARVMRVWMVDVEELDLTISPALATARVDPAAVSVVVTFREFSSARGYNATCNRINGAVGHELTAAALELLAKNLAWSPKLRLKPSE
jgi:hypothetical protein